MRFSAWISTCVLGVACTATIAPPPEPPTQETTSSLSGSNLAGYNLGGTNLAGTNLAGANLAGPNLGGTNLAGANLAGANLGGANLAGNNLGGANLAATNLGGANLAGTNLAGANLAGANLAGSSLGGSSGAGSNPAGNTVTGTSLAGSASLTSTGTGSNIHNLAAVTGMLYSGEDRWSSKSAQCVVMGIGSTAFPKLLGQQSSNARISVALGMLPWGFATRGGGPIALRAWEAVVWGDRTYCVFVLAAPPASTWAGVAGFIKAVFRWNAPPSQSMDVSGIEASAARDATVSTAIDTYPGMMNAGARWRAGQITAAAFVAGELAFASATTNNQSVLVDFASWVQDVDRNALVLGNVDPQNRPPYAEALYIALDNGDGTVSVLLDDAASRTTAMPPGMINSVADLDLAYQAWQAGIAPKPVPRRCGGALFLGTWFHEPVPAGKCDDGLTWAAGFCIQGSASWSTVAGTTAPMNTYMQLTQPGGAYKRALIKNGVCDTMKPVISETYVHMWQRSYDLTGSCSPESDGSFCGRLHRNCGSVTATDNCGALRTASCGGCAAPLTCGGSGTPNVCGNSNSVSYEGEALSSTISGGAFAAICPEAYLKLLGTGDDGAGSGACSGGGKVRYIGNDPSSYVKINNVTVPTSGDYQLTLYSVVYGTRSFSVSVNGGPASSVPVTGPSWVTPIATSLTVPLRAGANSIKLFNNTAYAPDLDRIVVTGVPAPPDGGTSPEGGTPGGRCALVVTQNVYDSANWWGTITFKNNGPGSTSAYQVAFSVPAGVHCTNDAVPFGAALSPLTGSGTSAYTSANQCVFTWSNGQSLASGASLTFNYSTDRNGFSSATDVTAVASACQ